MSWRCVVRDHPPQTFKTREAFTDHIKQAHPGKFRKDQLHFVAESSARALSPTVPACPFCTQEPGDLEDHVAQHLCHFALQSLPWPDHLDQDSENSSERDVNSFASEDVERETLKDDLNDSIGFIDAESLENIDKKAEPLLDTPVSWPKIGRAFPEPDQVLSEFAAHAARRASMAPNVNDEEPARLDDELRQIKQRFPDIVWNNTGMNSHLLRASLEGPWGSTGEHIMLNVQVAVPHDYPQAQAPSFLIEEDEQIPEVVHEKLQREVHEICQVYLQRKATCLAAAFSYLLGLGDLVERGHAIPLGDVNECKTAASPVSQPHGFYSAEVADKCKSAAPEKTDVPQKSGYLTKRGNNTGSWKSRFYVVDGQQLKYYDAEGGAQLGSIKLQGAQIGKQNARSKTSSSADTQLDHSMLILELQKGSNPISHVLCAGSDEERDLWVEALLPWTADAASNEMKTDSSTGNIWPTQKPVQSSEYKTRTGGTGHYYGTDSSAGGVWSTQEPVQSCGYMTRTDGTGHYWETDSSTGSMWSTQLAAQSANTRTMIKDKGQFVTVINHNQYDRPDEPSPKYRSANTHGKKS